VQAYLVEHYRPRLVLCLLEAASEELVREA
jgi:hypothetical protein